MDVRRALIWLFLRNTDIGRSLLGTQRRLTEQDIRYAVDGVRQKYYDIRYEVEKAKGNPKVLRAILKQGQVGNEPATFKFFENSDPTRVDIYYGGKGDNPLNNKDHGHIIIRNGTIVSWQEPGAIKDGRNRLY